MQVQASLSKKLEDEPSVALRLHYEETEERHVESLAAELAAQHEVSTGIGQGWKLLPRFQADRTALLNVYSSLVSALNEGRELSSTAEQFVKEFYLIDEQLELSAQRLTWRYYHDLPFLKSGVQAGYPRIYGVAHAVVTQLKGQLDLETLSRFLQAYQRTTPLTLREIRAFDLTLRIVLVKRIRRFAERIAEQQSIANLSEENLFADLNSLATLDWHKLFSRISVVDQILSAEHCKVYRAMDFTSQETYRSAVERLAKKSEVSEVEVARHALRLANEARTAVEQEREHVGYYLIDDGLPQLEDALSYSPALGERLVRMVRRRATTVYLSTLAILTATVAAVPLAYAFRNDASFSVLLVVVILSLIPASELALLLLKAAVGRVFKPGSLPRLDTSFGIPDSATTMVVVPTILSSLEQIKESLEMIESHYLTNQDSNIFFALLGDWKSAPQAELPEDELLLAAATQGVKELNSRYGDERFHLFHRRRLWNASEGDWEGWEKKRGKLCEFNRLLRGARDTSYISSTADPNFLKRVKFVISLDSDTELPRDAARKMVGTILHPLNRPQWDDSTMTVRRGYGILQPHTGSVPAKASVSQIPPLLSGYLGVNPYTDPIGVVSANVYQDFFREGNYVGKGLYDVDTFETALRDRIPENSVLSHDLLEGLYARCALVSDIGLFDRSPTNYLLNAKRNHRWTRGDWQLLPWLWPSVKAARGHYVRNSLSVIARWKILDNLRRSLVRPATLLWLVVGWTLLPGAPLSWTILILSIFAGAVFLDSAADMLAQLSRNRRASFRGNTWPFIRLSIEATVSSVVYLAHQTYLMLSAITRTLYRVFVSRRRLLEWVTAAQTQKESTLDIRLFVSYMWPAALASIMGLVVLLIYGSPAFTGTAAVLFAWSISPVFAWWMSARILKESETIEENMTLSVRLNARSTWKFLESSAAEISAPQASLRRLLVWSNAAHDLGAVSKLALLDRMESTVAEIERLFDTDREFRKPVAQQILLGEKGNLAGFLNAVPQRCRELASEPIFDDRVWDGLIDTLFLMKNEFLALRARTPRGQADAILYDLSEEIENCLVYVRGQRDVQTVSAWATALNIIQQRAAVLELWLNAFAEQCPAINCESLRMWASEFLRHAQELNRERLLLAPWTLVRTSHLEPMIRSYAAASLPRWNRIVDGLEEIASVASLPERSNQLLLEVAQLRSELNLTLTPVERDTAFRRCEELSGTLEDASRAAVDLKQRYENLARRCHSINHARSSDLFDEEFQLLRVQFQVNSISV